MKKRVKKNVQINIPMDAEVARRLRILAAFQDKTRSQFIRDILEKTAELSGDFRDGAFVVEVRSQT